MTRKALHLGFCLLVLAALVVTTAPAAQAIDFTYTKSGLGGTMTQACNAAIQNIKDHCDRYGTITTDPVRCWPVYGLDGQVVGQLCTCEATAAYCQILVPLSFQ